MWLRRVYSYYDNKKAPKEIVEINIETAFFWRHKIIDAIRKFIGYGFLEAVIELD